MSGTAGSAVKPSWAFLARFCAPEAQGWGAVRAWLTHASEALESAREELRGLHAHWTSALAPLPEVSDEDWRAFRPLRLYREEAWSDWLAHLLATSKTGVLAKELFGPSLGQSPSGQRLAVEREVATIGGERRGDILAQIHGGGWVHVEVKVGDQNFEKTFETAAVLRADYGQGASWSDFILLPPGDVGFWLAEGQSGDGSRPEVAVITWRDVAVALRKALVRGEESLPWRAWAHSLCGAVEQLILGCLPAGDIRRGSDLQRLRAALEQITVMREGRE